MRARRAQRLKRSPFWLLGMLVGFILLCVYLWRTHAMTQGHFIFALDDPYISMGIAKNLVQAGTWGTSAQDFSSASSSILWPIALAIGFVGTRFSPYTPYLLNLAALIFAALHVRRIVARQLPRMRSQSFWSLLLFWMPAMAAPVTTLLLTGLEHIWHWVAVFCAVDAAAVALACPQDKKLEKRAILWAAALTLVRYESMALVAIVALLFLASHRFFAALKYGASGFAPVILFGLWSMTQGAMFFPNSLVLKASPGGAGLLGKVYVALERSYHSLSHHTAYSLLIVSAILTLGLLLVKQRWKLQGPRRICAIHLISFVGMALAHSAFASFGWLYRYEAYLLAWGSFAISLGLLQLLQARLDQQPISIANSPIGATQAVLSRFFSQRGWAWYRNLALAACTLYSGQLLWKRSLHASHRAVLATRNIYEQQYQFARFLGEHYPGQAIALNDIGTSSFFPDVRVIDLYGLGSTKIAMLKKRRAFNQAKIKALGEEYKVPAAIIYDGWFRGYGGMPKSWVRVGGWKIHNNVVCGGDTISFYGTSPAHAQDLAKKLRAFAPKLPKRVQILPEPGFDLGRSKGRALP